MTFSFSLVAAYYMPTVTMPVIGYIPQRQNRRGEAAVRSLQLRRHRRRYESLGRVTALFWHGNENRYFV